MDKAALGNRIRLARKDAGLTGERLSEYCNINAVYLRQIECGAKMPSLPLFISLCEKLNVSPSYLLADILPHTGNQDLDALIKLCSVISPQQINMIISILEKMNDYVPKASPPPP